LAPVAAPIALPPMSGAPVASNAAPDADARDLIVRFSAERLA
jgi:hypothetical protein